MRHLGLLVVVAILWHPVAALAQERVPEATIQQYIAQSYDNPGPIKITALKQFPDGTTGTGRISLTGTLTFDHNIYVETYGMEEALKAAGFTGQEIDYYGVERGVRSPLSGIGFLFNVYDIEHGIGDVLLFTADYQYKETASGFWFGLNSSTLKFYGKRLEDLPSTNRLLVGSIGFKQMLSLLEQSKVTREALIATAQADLEAELSGVTFFASMPIDTKEDPVRWSDRFQIDTSAPTMRWVRASPDHLEFGVQGEATFFLAAHWFDDDRAPGEKFRIVLRGDLYLNRGGEVLFRIGLSEGKGGFDDDYNTFRREPFDGHEGFVSNEVRLSKARTITPPPPVKIVWETVRAKRSRLALFDLDEEKCMAIEASRGRHLMLMLNADLDRDTSVSMPSKFVLAGPKHNAGLWYDGTGSVDFRFRTFDKTNGACDLG